MNGERPGKIIRVVKSGEPCEGNIHSGLHGKLGALGTSLRLGIDRSEKFLKCPLALKGFEHSIQHGVSGKCDLCGIDQVARIRLVRSHHELLGDDAKGSDRISQPPALGFISQHPKGAIVGLRHVRPQARSTTGTAKGTGSPLRRSTAWKRLALSSAMSSFSSRTSRSK